MPCRRKNVSFTGQKDCLDISLILLYIELLLFMGIRSGHEKYTHNDFRCLHTLSMWLEAHVTLKS